MTFPEFLTLNQVSFASHPQIKLLFSFISLTPVIIVDLEWGRVDWRLWRAQDPKETERTRAGGGSQIGESASSGGVGKEGAYLEGRPCETGAWRGAQGAHGRDGRHGARCVRSGQSVRSGGVTFPAGRGGLRRKARWGEGALGRRLGVASGWRRVGIQRQVANRQSGGD